MRWAIIAAALVAAGCASTSNIPDAQSAYNALNAAYVGRSVDRVAARFGLPDRQDVFQGQQFYIWNASETMQWRQDVNSTTSGAVGDLQAYPYVQVPYVQRTSSTQYAPETYRCALQVAVDSAGIVRRIGLVGKMGACKNFMP